METFELRYFLGAAKFENIHRAAEDLHVSPASLSKAVRRLEDELGVKLFSRVGRNIQLTDHGRFLQKRAADIIFLEEVTRAEISGVRGTLNVTLAGSEILLVHFATGLIGQIKKLYPRARFELSPAQEADALDAVESGQAHLALISSKSLPGWLNRTLGQARFITCVGPGHPLQKRASGGRPIPVEELLKHAFVSPSLPILGEIKGKGAWDGWRDDRFPRQIDFRTTSLKTLESLVLSGAAVAYLPDYLAKSIGATPLTISGCPFVCQQTIRLVARSKPEAAWIRHLFREDL